MITYKDELRIKKQRRLILVLALFLFAVIGVATGLSYFLFFTKIFDVRAVNIDAPESVSVSLGEATDKWLDAGIWRFTRRNNILFVSAEQLAAQLGKEFPALGLVVVVKNFPHAILISAVERKPLGTWCVSKQGKCFYFDKNGTVYVETQPSSGFLLANVVDHQTEKLKLGDALTSWGWFENIMSARDLLARAGINVYEFVIPVGSFDEFDARTSYGWKIMFGNSTDIKKQVGALSAFLEEKLTPEQKSQLQYIDLRIQDRIYYK